MGFIRKDRVEECEAVAASTESGSPRQDTPLVPSMSETA